MPYIEIEIDEEGEVLADFLGFEGTQCKIAEDELIKKLKDLSIAKTGEQLKPGAVYEKERRKR